MFWSLFVLPRPRHGNLHQSSVTMSMVTYFILRANTGTGVSHSQHGKRFWKGEWAGREEISKEEIPGSKRSLYVYILTYSRL